MPTDEETELLRPYKSASPRTITSLGQAEQLYLELIEIPRLKPRLEAILFRKVFPDSVRRLKERVRLGYAGVTELRTSKKFFTVLEAILTIGNILNEGTPAGGAAGFRLDSLSRVSRCLPCLFL